MKLKDVCLHITDGVHSTVIDDSNGLNFLLSSKNIKNGRIIFNNERKINHQTLCNLRRRTLMSKDDVILTTVGTIGEVAIVNKDEPNYEFQRSVAILKPNKKLILPLYLKYYLMSFKGQCSIKERIKGAAQPCLFLMDLKDIDIYIHTLKNQQHIVNTISSLLLKFL